MTTTTFDYVSEPVIASELQVLRRFADELRRCGYDVGGCAKRLGVNPRLGVKFWQTLRPGWTPQSHDPVDTLIALFIDGDEVDADRVVSQTSRVFVDAAIEMRLLEEDEQSVRSRLCLFPCYGKYLVTDRAAKNPAFNQVMWLWAESFILGGLVKRSPRRRAIDLGTGSGIHAILAGDHCAKVTSVDINPRAIAFATFNAALNGLNNIDFVLSDLFESVESTCDLLLANPPYAPDMAAQAGENFWSGGPKGTDILQRIVRAIPTRLDRDGSCHIVSLYPNPPGTTIREHFDTWLGGEVNRYEVLDHTWPVPYYKDILSDEPFEGDKSAWRFGVVSLRRPPTGDGWWKVMGSNRFFASDGSCRAIADHEASQT